MVSLRAAGGHHAQPGRSVEHVGAELAPLVLWHVGEQRRLLARALRRSLLRLLAAEVLLRIPAQRVIAGRGTLPLHSI